MALALAIAMTLGGCAAPGTVPASAELAGSRWRLLEFRPAQGAPLVPASPDRFVLRFAADGRLTATLDCNQGTGPWTASASGAAVGSLHIGPLATTRMMCPPDPIGERLARDLDAVSAYRLEAGRLQFGAPGGAGTYVWERISP